MPASPEVLGFTIAEYYLNGGKAVDSTSPENKTYQTDSLSLNYDSKKYFYRLFVKMKNNNTSAYPNLTILAIMYTDSQRDPSSPALPLLGPQYPGQESPVEQILSFYDADKAKNFPYYERHQRAMDRDSRGYPYYYGELQFNYKFTNHWYDTGTLIIEMNIGGGEYKGGKVDQWLVNQTCNWIIPNFT